MRRTARPDRRAARLLEQVTQREVRLRERQGEQARNRAAITEKRGKKARPKVTKAERKLQAEMSALASERAWLYGPRPLALMGPIPKNAEATRTS